jgi:hypothetical protein
MAQLATANRINRTDPIVRKGIVIGKTHNLFRNTFYLNWNLP